KFDFAVVGTLSSANIGSGKRRYRICCLRTPARPFFAVHAWRFPLDSSGHMQGSAGAEQLEQIVGETDQFPFRSHLLQSAQQEPSEPAPLFDLPEHRFHDRL